MLWILLLVAMLLLGVAIVVPHQFGLRPKWWQHPLGRSVDPVARLEAQRGYIALNRNSSRFLGVAKACFERAVRVDAHDVQAQAGLAETQLAMAGALLDAAEDMTHFSANLSLKERQRAQHDAAAQRHEAKAWVMAARPAAETAVHLSPHNVAARRAMAQQLQQGEDLKGAATWVQGGLTGKSTDPGLMAVQADLLAASDIKGAIALLEQCVQAAPHNNRLRYRLARLYLKRQQSLRALEQIQAILAAAPEHELAQQMLMCLQPAASQADKVVYPVVLSFRSPIDTETPTAAESKLPATLDSGRASATATSRAARPPTEAARTPPGAARSPSERQAARPPIVTSSTPPRPPPAPAPLTLPLRANVQKMTLAELLQHGQQLLQAHHAAEALAVYQLAVHRAPTEVSGLLGTGWCELELGQATASVVTFEAATRQAPWLPEPHFGLAEAYRHAGRRRDAIYHYRHYLSIEPGGAHAEAARHMLEDLSR